MATEPAPNPLDNIREVVLARFPFLERFRTIGKRLAIRSAGEGIDLEGGAKGVARVDDAWGRLYFDTVSATLYYSPSTSAPFAWAPIASGIIAPLPAEPGTAIALPVGSDRVTCG